LIKHVRGKQGVIIVHGCAYRKVIFEIVLIENPDVVIDSRKESSSVLIGLECEVEEKIVEMIVDIPTVKEGRSQ
jgi:hypothetical protein